MFHRLAAFLNRPRLAFALLVLSGIFLALAAYGGRFHFAWGGLAFRSSEGWRVVAFFLFSLVYWTATLDPRRLTARGARTALLVLYLLAAVMLFSPDIGSDGSSYYAQLRTLVLDRDLNFYNEIAAHPELWAENELDSLHTGGYTYIGYPFGPAVFWLPFFLAGHVQATLMHALGLPVVADGYSAPCRWWTLLGTAFYGFVGAWLTFRMLSKRASPFAALWGTLLAVLGTPLLSYLFVEPSFSHALSFMLGAAFIYAWVCSFGRDPRPPGWKAYLLLGWLLGLLTLARWQNLVFGIIPALDFMAAMTFHLRKMPGRQRLAELAVFEHQTEQRKALVRTVVRYAGMGAFAFLGILPQFIVWKTISGGFFLMPQGEGYVNWTQLSTWRVLFDPLHGMFLMHPLMLLGLLGGVFLWRRAPRLILRLYLVFILQLYVNSVVHDWWAGGAFGQRRFSSVLPLVALGLAALLDWRPRRKVWTRGLFLVLLLLLLWNFMLLAEYRIGPMGALGPMDGEVAMSAFDGLGWKKLADFVAYRPIFRSLREGLLHANPRLFGFGATVTLALAAGFCFVIRRGRLRARWPVRAELAGSGVLVGASILLLLQAMAGAETRSVVVLRPAQQFGSVLDLRVYRNHAYEGGFARFTLAPGESRPVILTRRVVADEIVLVAALDAPETGPDHAAVTLWLETEDGRRLPLVYTYPEDIERFDAARYRRDGALLDSGWDVARSWQPNSGSSYLYRTYRCTRVLPQPERLVGISVESRLVAGAVRVEGIAFNHAEVGSRLPPPSRFMPLSLDSIANADWKHNPFVPHGSYDPHYQITEGTLFRGAEPFVIPKSAADGGEWTIFTTCSEEKRDAWLPIAAQPLERIDFLVCGGLIRKRGVFDLVEVIARYVDGEVQSRTLAANRDVFDYFDPFADPAHLAVGHARSYQYAGPMRVVSLELDRPGVAVDGIFINDVRTDQPQGVTFFAATAVRAAPEGDPTYLYPDGSIEGPELHSREIATYTPPIDLAAALEGGFHVLCADGSVYSTASHEPEAGQTTEPRRIAARAGGYVVLDATGGLHCGGDGPPLAGKALSGPWAMDVILTPQGEGFYILDAYGAVHAGGNAQPLGPGPYFGEPIAVDLEWSYERYGQYVLDRTGAVSRIGAAPYYGRAFMEEGEYATDMQVFPAGYAILTSTGRLIRLGDVPDFTEPDPNVLRMVWENAHR